MTLQVGHRVVLRDGGEWSVLSINAERRLVRLGDRLYRPQELRVVAFAEILEIAGWDRGDGTTERIDGNDEDMDGKEDIDGDEDINGKGENKEGWEAGAVQTGREDGEEARQEKSQREGTKA